MAHFQYLLYCLLKFIVKYNGYFILKTCKTCFKWWKVWFYSKYSNSLALESTAFKTCLFLQRICILIEVYEECFTQFCKCLVITFTDTSNSSDFLGMTGHVKTVNHVILSYLQIMPDMIASFQDKHVFRFLSKAF